MANTEPVPETGCWLFAGSWGSWGYGHVRVGSRTDGSRRVARAHRVSWEEHYGPIPKGMLVCHKCDTPACVNPDHLFLGTPQDNAIDMGRKGRNYTGNSPPLTRGEHHHKSRVTAEQVKEIRALEGSLPQEGIALKYGIGQTTVSNILRRVTWKHID